MKVRHYSHKRKPYFVTIATILLIVLLPAAYYLTTHPSITKAEWADDTFAYRNSVSISSHTAAETNVYISVTINTSASGQFQSDCGDLRWYTNKGVKLKYYVSSGCTTASTVVHVLFENQFPAGAQTIYYYYGNSYVANGFQSSGFSTQATNYVIGTIASQEKSPAPIAYWKFDEGTGTAANDASANKHTGTLTSGPTWQSEDGCVTGKCLKLDGVDDYVAAGIGTDYLPMSTFSVCTWLRTPGLATGMSVNGIFSLTYGLTMFLNSSGQVVTRIDDGAAAPTYTVGPNLHDNKWHYVCMTYDGVNRHTYTDGVERGSTPTTWLGTTRWPTNTVSIGHENNNPPIYKFNGFLDDVKLFSYALSADQIKTNYNAGKSRAASAKGVGVALGSNNKGGEYLSDGLVTYWKLDESSCGPADFSGNSNAGTCASTPTVSVGKFGNGVTFDGSTNQTISKSDSTSLSVSNVTVSLWAKIAATTGNYQVLAWKNTDYEISLDPTLNPRFGITTTGGNRTATTTAGSTLSTGTWYHITLTYDGTTMKGYLNGSQILSQAHSNPGNIIDSTSSFIVSDTSYDVSGTVDEVRVYNRALSPKEVSDLYNWAPGPIAHYKLDENTGSTANDISGNSNTGTLTLGPTWSTGKYGASVKFDGSDDYITVADSSSLDLTNGVTVSSWVYLDTNKNYNQILTKGVDAGENFEMYTTSTGSMGGEWTFASGRVGCASLGSTTLSTSQWYYISTTFDGTSCRTYLNGVLVNTTSIGATTITTNNNALQIGGDTSAAGRYLDGQIDDVRIYNYARTQKQIVEDMNAGHPNVGSPVGSAIGHWKFDEGYGTTANNSGSQGNTISGTLNNGPTWTNNGKFNKAITFDGVDDSVSKADVTALDITGTITLSAWIKPTASDANGTIISKPGAYYLERHSDNKIQAYFYGISSPGYHQSTSTVPNNAWSHVLTTYDGSNVKIFINGVLDKTVAATGSITNSANSFYIGSLEPGFDAYEFTGSIDETKVYNYALTADEVKLEYNRGSAQVLGALGDNTTYEKGAASQEYCVPGDTTSCNPPVAEYNFEEGSGSTIRDKSGNGYVSNTVLGSPSWATGKIGSSLSFNGSTDGIGFSGPTTYSDETMTAWVYIDSTSPTGDIVGNAHTNSNAYGFTFYYDSASSLIRAKAETNADQYFYTNVTADVTNLKNRWIHLGMSWDNLGTGSGGCDATVKLYVNGVLIDSDTDNVTNTPYNCTYPYPYPFTVGATTTTSLTRATKVKVDQVRVYHYVRTPAQIAWDYNRGAPVAHWKFDECQGSTANDSSGNNLSGTITIGATGTQDELGTCNSPTDGSGAWYNGRVGKLNSSLNFDGTNDYISAPTSNSLSFGTSDFSISLWVNPTSFGAEAGLYDSLAIGGGGGRANAFILVRNITTGKLRIFTNGSYTSSTTNALILNNWNHVTIVRSGTTISFYINGVIDPVSVTVGTDITSGNAVIGRYSDVSSGYFTGKVDDTSVFNYALSATQVKLLYNNNATTQFAPITGTP